MFSFQDSQKCRSDFNGTAKVNFYGNKTLFYLRTYITVSMGILALPDLNLICFFIAVFHISYFYECSNNNKKKKH